MRKTRLRNSGCVLCEMHNEMQEAPSFVLVSSSRISGCGDACMTPASLFVGESKFLNKTFTDILLQSAMRRAHKWPVLTNDTVLLRIANPASVEAGAGEWSWDSSFVRHSEVLREEHQGR